MDMGLCEASAPEIREAAASARLLSPCRGGLIWALPAAALLHCVAVLALGALPLASFPVVSPHQREDAEDAMDWETWRPTLAPSEPLDASSPSPSPGEAPDALARQRTMAAEAKENPHARRLLASRAVLPPSREALVQLPAARPEPDPGPGPKPTPPPGSQPAPPSHGQPEPVPPDPLDMRREPARPAARRPVDLTYRPAPQDLDLPGPVTENPQRPPRPDAEPPLVDRVIPRRPVTAGIFRLTPRGEPEYDGQILRWRPGGTWAYRGPGGTFDATVGPDGGLAFRDHGSVSPPRSARPSYGPPLEDPSTPHLRPSGGVAMWTLSTFDVTDAVMRRTGQDPYNAEKRRFASATASWRRGLRDGWQAERHRRAVEEAGASGPLCRRYQAATEEGRRAIRRELFQRWDECLEDVKGQAVRGAILAAIRRCGITFPQAELAALNSRRESREPFAP